MNKVENLENLISEGNDEKMSRLEMRLLIDYLTNVGWSAEQIVDLIKYISR